MSMCWCEKCKTIMGGKFCRRCGEKTINAEFKCPNCGQNTTVIGKFCDNCGQPVHEAVRAHIEEELHKMKGGDEQKLECGDV